MKEGKCNNHKGTHSNYKNQFIYSKVDNDKRMVLLKMVKEHGKSLKEASNLLKINYSTAKTILRVFRIENRILKKTSIRNKKKSKCDCALTETRPDINSNPESPALKQSTQQNKENSKKSCDLGNFSLNKTENVKANDVNDITSGINKMLNIPVLNTALTTEKKQNDLNLIKLGNSISNSNANGYGYSNYSHSQRNDLNTKLTNSIPLQNMKMNQIQKYLNSVSSVYPMNTNANHANTNVNSNIYGNSLSILSIQEYLQRIRLNMNYIQDCFKEIDHNSAIIRNINFLINKIKTHNMY